jgi:hypothetical protein
MHWFSLCSSVVEHFLGKEEVGGSIPPIGSKIKWLFALRAALKCNLSALVQFRYKVLTTTQTSKSPNTNQ